MLNLFVSEMSEVIVSMSSMVCIGGMHVSPNKEHSYLSRGMTTTDIQRTLGFLAFDVACELLLFVMLCSFVKLGYSFDVLAAGREYFHHMHFRGACLCWLVVSCLVNMIQTFDHVGMDPTFRFAWI